MVSLQLEELITFITLAKMKNFTRTAEKLLMSQPSVSLHIKNLEKEFQTTLFYRSPKSLKITPTGELLLERAKQIIQIYENAKEEIFEMNNSIKGKMIIGSSLTIGESILPPLLRKLQRHYDELELEVTIKNSEEIVKLVRHLEVDIGLIEGEVQENDLQIVPFMEDELCIVAPNDHPLAKKKCVTIEELQGEVWISREVGSGTRDYLHHVIHSNGLKVKSMITINSNQGVKELVKSGIGLSMLSKRIIQKELKHNDFSLIKLKTQSFKRTFSYVVSPSMENNKNVNIFLQILKRPLEK